MSAMIKLSDGCWVAATEIAEIKIGTTNATVRTKDGIGHTISALYGHSIHDTIERLVDLINEAAKE